MKLFQNLSIKNQLILMVLSVSMLSLMIGFSFEIYKSVKTLKKEMLEYSTIQAQMIADYCTAPLTFESKEGVDQILSRLDDLDLIQSVLVLDSQGNLFTSYSKSGVNVAPFPQDQNTKNHFYSDYLQIIEPIEHNNNFYGYLVVNLSTSPLNSKIREIVIEITFSLVVLVIISLLLANYLQNYFSGPILELANITENISNFGDYHTSSKINRKDEIGRLYNSFHDMMNQLQENEQEIQKFNEQLLYSLREKEVLIKEIHHRVKNNLQIIISLFNLQLKKPISPESQQTLLECKNRVFSMSIVHEKLYQSSDLAKIDFQSYIHSLILHFQSIYKKDRDVNIINHVNNISFDINYAIPLGLMLNELISNSYKHAFTDMDKGEIIISVQNSHENKINIHYCDNGTGFPQDMTDLGLSSLGITLITNLVKQLDGKIEFKNMDGAHVYINFEINPEAV